MTLGLDDFGFGLVWVGLGLGFGLVWVWISFALAWTCPSCALPASSAYVPYPFALQCPTRSPLAYALVQAIHGMRMEQTPGSKCGLDLFQAWQECRMSNLYFWCLLSVGMEEKR